MSEHHVAKPIKMILSILLIAIFWEFFIGEKYYPNIDISKTQEQKEIDKAFVGVDKYLVKRVIDGDTFVVEDKASNTGETRVRMIGLNTPESVDPRRPVECFGKEASNYLKSIIDGKSVYLETDSTQGNYDKYSRLLAYVVSDTGEDINNKMILDGYGYEYTYQKSNPYKKQTEYKQSQNLAKFAERGLWNKDACK